MPDPIPSLTYPTHPHRIEAPELYCRFDLQQLLTTDDSVRIYVDVIPTKFYASESYVIYMDITYTGSKYAELVESDGLVADIKKGYLEQCLLMSELDGNVHN